MNRLNEIFKGMKMRCYSPNRHDYKYYGGRGVTICNEWFTPGSWKGWLKFKDWALSHGYQDGLTIDRIDINMGYSPDNCRWVTMKVQNNNKTNNHFVTYNGKTQSISDWCMELGLPCNVIRERFIRGWSVDRAFKQKIRRSK